jgi:hypothetical protein
MGRISDAVVAYIEQRGWPHELDAGRDLVSFPAMGNNGQWTIVAAAREADEQLLVHSLLEIDVPVDRRVELALFLTRANFGLVIGNFELDLDDGELRYKTSVDVEGTELTEPMIDQLVLANVAITDRYLPGIVAVLQGAEPQAAVASIEA